ncbi:hypothetical protein HAX54_027979 [Datura stramonium]|uniref:peroxidase n=1 Tax=Datura stramonium TaxID=4076 RepID=A0ABS8S940_DATST|nr:hypothetical protein [Datura stramonium]
MHPGVIGWTELREGRRIYYDVQAGRRDGRVSIDSETLTNLPSPFVDAKELIRNFMRKGMSVDEMSICPPEVLTNGTGLANPVNLDVLTPNKLDNKYYLALKSQKGLLISDQALMAHPTTAKLVNYNARYSSIWPGLCSRNGSHGYWMSSRSKGEIRRNCHFMNQDLYLCL